MGEPLCRGEEMKLIERSVYVVMQPTRGRSHALAVFNEELHASKFIEKMKLQTSAVYSIEVSTLYEFLSD
jgi:hypothetical protein